MGELITQDERERRYQSVASMLQGKAMLEQLRMALPKHVTPQRLARIVLTEIRRTPKLLECNRESLLGSILQAAQLGLEPGLRGQCWIIPYGAEATFIPGYQGLAQLAWRSSMVASIAARAVFDGDTFSFDFGADTISHKPSGASDPAKLTHVYAVIHTTNGGRLWDVMTRAEVDRIRDRSRAGKSGPWVTDYAEMAKKTVLRRLFKIAPCSAEMQTALALDDAADSGVAQGLDFTLPQEEPRDVTPVKADGSAPAAEIVTAEDLAALNDLATARAKDLGDTRLAAQILRDVANGRRLSELPRADLDAVTDAIGAWGPPTTSDPQSAPATAQESAA